MENINHLAVLVAAVASFLIGGIWYSPLMFQKAWMRSSGMTDEKVKAGNPAKTFGLSFIFAYVMAYNMAFFFGDGTDITAMTGLMYGFLTGFGFAFMAFAVNAMFEQKSLAYVLINGGYMVVYLSVIGLVLGAWR